MSEITSVYVAGHRGLVGSAVMRRFARERSLQLMTADRSQLDLRDGATVSRYLAEKRPDWVIVAAARVGGIQANNTLPADFIRENLQIQTSVIDGAFRAGVRKLLFLGSSCIYPKFCPQPIKEEYLLTGLLEPTNEWYAIAKIAGLKMCQAYRRQYGFNAICAMPTNLYGPGDNFDLENSHVLPALIRKFDDAARTGASHVTIWGSGTPRREFLHVDDLADALLHLMRSYDQEEPINVGSGSDVSILELADIVAEATGFRGELQLDTSKPDGTPRKLLDVSRLNTLGWRATISLREGIASTVEWYRRLTTFS